MHHTISTIDAVGDVGCNQDNCLCGSDDDSLNSCKSSSGKGQYVENVDSVVALAASTVGNGYNSCQ